MLREIQEVSQNSGEPDRRWFSSTSMDLLVWVNQDEEIVSYQPTYDKPHTEKALTRKKVKVFCTSMSTMVPARAGIRVGPC